MTAVNVTAVKNSAMLPLAKFSNANCHSNCITSFIRTSAKMSKYAKYAELTKLSTNYARRMNRLSNRIFGEVVRPTNQKSMRVVRLFSEQPINQRRDIKDYYPRHVETGILMQKLRDYGLFRDEHLDFAEEMERMRVLRGKGKRIKNKNDQEAASS